jgi:hypothetical protein
MTRVGKLDARVPHSGWGVHHGFWMNASARSAPFSGDCGFGRVVTRCRWRGVPLTGDCRWRACSWVLSESGLRLRLVLLWP